jgi:beta-N-acetylhexosaminidase
MLPSMFRIAYICLLTVGLAAPSGDRPLPSGDYTPEEAFYDRNYQWVDSLMATMTTDEKIGQLFMVAAYSNKDVAHEKAISMLIRDYHIGGLIFMQGGPVRQAKLTNAYQNSSKYPLLIAMDAEWGPAMRLDSVIAFQRQLTWGAVKDDSLIYYAGQEIARQLVRLGVQVSFSPVIDINNNPNNPVIGDRSFGEDKFNVALKGIAYMNGLQENGILACGKHFPGHGDTDADSHKTLPVINHSRERLDTLELFPFSILMNQGLGSIMLAHLFIPSLDDTPGQASSLSADVGRTLLRDSLGFRGLVFSDALNMSGVAAHFKPGELEVKAFLAGNDVLLFSQDVPTAFQAIKSAIADGRISEERLNESVTRILKAKAFTGLDERKPVDIKNITADINSDAATRIKRKITEQSITLLGNDTLLPLENYNSLKIATLAIGVGKQSAMQTHLDNYTTAVHYTLNHDADAAAIAGIKSKLSSFDLVIIGISDMKRSAAANFGIAASMVQLVSELAATKPVIVSVFGSPYAAGLFASAQNVIVAFDDAAYTQQCVAEAIFGAKPFRGVLPVGSKPFQANEGISTASLSRLQWGIPEDVGMNPAIMKRLDSIARACIDVQAAPGLTVLVAKEGRVVWDKSYGYFKYDKKTSVNTKNIYDLASVSKVASTTLALMKLYDDSLYNTNQRVEDILPETRGSVAGPIVLQDLLTHQAGLIAWIPFYKQTLNSDGTLNPLYYNQSKIPGFTTQVADNIYMRDDYRDSIWQQIIHTPLKEKNKYVYSDLTMYIARRIIEKLSGNTLDQYVEANFYGPLHMDHTCYNPLQRYPKSSIVPTENDNYFRFQTVQGYVHDMGAAMMGGVEGHAGLFSNSHDLAVLFQMLLNDGYYGGKQYIQPETVELFTKKQSNISRRGLGWDKAETNPSKGNPCSSYASDKTFGHQGFTGICVWADPEYDLLFIFLSNRVQPAADPNKLSSENIRNKMMDVVYESFLAGTSVAGM